jgi:hypothetical protein
MKRKDRNMAAVPLHRHDVFPPDRKLNLTKADIKRGAAPPTKPHCAARASAPAQAHQAAFPIVRATHLRGGFSRFRVLTRRNEFERSCEMECATLENSPCREPLLS